MATASFAAYAAGFFLRSFYTPDASFWTLTLPLFLQGFALSMFFVPLLHILLDGIPPERVPSATGISNFARITSGGFAASLITTFWDRREALHQSRLVESANGFSPVYRQATEQLQAQGMNSLQAAGTIMRETVKQAYLLSSLDIFYASGWLAMAMVLVVWITRKPVAAKHVAAAD
jgi:MFS transporter, DHA2 family, multidrug resistance protein